MADLPKTVPPTKVKKLRDKWKRFVDELITTYNRQNGEFNYAEAYSRVYPGSKNREISSRSGSKLLKEPTVQAYFCTIRDQMLAKLAADVRLTLQEERAFENRKEDVLKELACIGYTRMTDLAQWDEDGITLVASDQLNQMHAAAVRKVKQRRTQYFNKDGDMVSERTDMEIETHDKVGALELLGRNASAFGDDASLVDKPYAVLIPMRRDPGKPIVLQKEKGA